MEKMQLKQSYKIIVAMGLGNEIGAAGDLLWRLPKDMLWFKENTMGADVMMGRKTYESFPKKFRPLPNRTNIIISTNKDYAVPEGVFVCPSLEAAFSIAENCTETQKYIIGGGKIYELALPFCSEILLTRVHSHFPEADTFFPALDAEAWQELWTEHHTRDEKHAYDFSFSRWQRK